VSLFHHSLNDLTNISTKPFPGDKQRNSLVLQFYSSRKKGWREKQKNFLALIEFSRRVKKW